MFKTAKIFFPFQLVFLAIAVSASAQSVRLEADSNIMLVGDSFTNGSTEWARRVDLSLEYSLDFFSAGGRTLSTMACLFPSQYQVDTYDAVVIAGGVNDVLFDRNLSQIQASINSIISQTNGEPIILTTIPPFRGRADLWTASRQEVADQVDDWVSSLAENSSNISVFDIRKVLDVNDDQIIDAESSSSDMFHPGICDLDQVCGSSIIADAFINKFFIVLGDLNQDGVANFLDIAPFISILATGGFQVEADIDRDEAANFLDIGPFIEVLSSN